MIKTVLNIGKNFVSSRLSGYLSIAGALACLFLLWFIYDCWKKDCEKEALIQNVEKIDQRIEISNNRPDDAAFFAGLLGDDEW